MRFSRPFGIIFILFAWLSCGESGDSANSIGQGGSLTRFAINNTFLYIATNARIAVYDISENNFKHIKDVPVGFGLELSLLKVLTCTWAPVMRCIFFRLPTRLIRNLSFAMPTL